MYSVSEVLNDLNQIYSNGHARNTGQVKKLLLGEWTTAVCFGCGEFENVLLGTRL